MELPIGCQDAVAVLLSSANILELLCGGGVVDVPVGVARDERGLMWALRFQIEADLYGEFSWKRK